MPKLDEQIATLEERLKKLKLRHQHTEIRRKALEAKRERKADTRRKILLGGVILGRLAERHPDRELIRGWLDQSLTRNADRELFGLALVSPEVASDTQ